MHVLVTGGTGFIGGALCQALTTSGQRVTVLTRSVARAGRHLPAGVSAVEELDDLKAIDAVYNLAGENLASQRWTPARKRALLDSRINTTKRLFSWMEGLEKRPSVLISASAVGFYGPQGDAVITESAPPGHDFAARLCQSWEAEARRAEALNVRVCIVRFGLVLGPNGGVLAKLLPAFRLGGGGPMGTGQQWVSWIHRGDLIRLLLWTLMQPSARGVYNATAPRPVTNAELARTLGRVLRRPSLLRMPAVLLKPMLGELADLLITGQKVLPQRAQEEGFTFEYLTLEPALRQLLNR